MEHYSFNIKSIFTFGLIFVSLIVIYLLMMSAASAIPSKNIQNNIKNSTVTLLEADTHPIFEVSTIKATRMANFTDAAMLNIIYTIDPKHYLQSPLLSEMSAVDTIMNQTRQIENPFGHLKEIAEDKAINRISYARYWHGYIVLFRPLFVFFNYLEIRLINMAIFSMLVFLLIISTIKKVGRFAVMSLATALIYINWFVIPLLLNYIPIFYVAFVVSLLILNIDIRKEKTYLKLIFISGSLTSFLDLLTAPLITLGIPLLFIVIKNKEYINKQTMRQVIFFLLRFVVFWLLGYTLTWLAKIIIMQMMRVDMISEFIEQVRLRVGDGSDMNPLLLRFHAIARNIRTMFFGFYWLLTLLILTFVFITGFLYRRKKVSPVFFAYLFIALFPYGWYFIASNHSDMHDAFTFRIQMMTVIGLLLAYKESIDMEKLKSRFTMLREKIFSKKTIKQITDI